MTIPWKHRIVLLSFILDNEKFKTVIMGSQRDLWLAWTTMLSHFLGTFQEILRHWYCLFYQNQKLISMERLLLELFLRKELVSGNKNLLIMQSNFDHHNFIIVTNHDWSFYPSFLPSKDWKFRLLCHGSCKFIVELHPQVTSVLFLWLNNCWDRPAQVRVCHLIFRTM